MASPWQKRIGHDPTTFLSPIAATQLTTLQGKAAAYTDNHSEWWQQTTQTLHEGLRACETSDILLTQPLTIAIPTPLPSSQWSERTQMLQHWHHQIARGIKDSKPQTLLQVNTDTAQKLIQHMAQEIEAQLGPAPCVFALLGAGSYSRGETSFGSDIDFAVLISDAAAQQHAYFQGFLDLLTFKTASFPDGVFPLEAKELSAMKKGECWIDTPANLIAEHCYLPGSERGQGSGFDRSFPLRWPKLLYTSQHPAANALWQEYQNHLTAFFQQRDSRDVPYYRLVEP